MGAPTGLSTVGARSKGLSDDVYGRSSARTLAKGVATKDNRRKPDRKASQRKATDESPTERRRNERQPTKACLPRHGPFAHPVCVAARKPHFRPGNPPRHVRSGTSVCAATSGAKRIFRSNYLSDNFVIISIISTFAPCE